MHDPQYRTAIAWQNSAYNQPPHPSFFLGYDMAAPPTPNIQVVSASLGVNKPAISLTSEVLAYPNPTKGQFTVQLNGTTSSKANIVVTNMVGQIITQKEVKLTDGKQTMAFNISNQAEGIYLLKVVTPDGVDSTLKIVLEK
jgi:hypothetical protein